jgi:hypothetical protein
MAFGRKVRRKRDGRIELRLSAEERDVLSHVTGQLREAMLVDTDAAGLRRLFPPAYVEDAEKEAGFKALARDELLEARLAALDTVDAVLADPMMTVEQAGGVMQSLNALRLVLGTRLDVSEDDDPHVDPDDPDGPAWALYYFLSALVAEIVDVLAGDLT